MTTLNPEEQEKYNMQDCWKKEEDEPSTLIKTVQKYMAEKPNLSHLSASIAKLKKPSPQRTISEKQLFSLDLYFSLVFMAYEPHERNAKEIQDAWVDTSETFDDGDPACYWFVDAVHEITASEFEHQAVMNMSGLVAIAEAWTFGYQELLSFMRSCLQEKENCKDAQGERLKEFNSKLAAMTSILDQAYDCLAILFEKGRVLPESWEETPMD